MISRLELIGKRDVDYSQKNAAVLINPSIGDGDTIQESLSHFLHGNGINHSVFISNQPLDPYRLANKDIDLDKYSILIIVGGDGTVSEAVNGMLAREDRKRVPIAVVPIGRSNDFATSLGIADIQLAVDAITNAEAIAIDTTRVLLDRDSETGLPSDESRLN